MPSKIEKLIAKWRGYVGRDTYENSIDCGNASDIYKAGRNDVHAECADELDCAYREEVVPLVEALRDIRDYWNMDKNEKAMGDALDHIVEVSEGALAVFDAPAPEEPK